MVAPETDDLIAGSEVFRRLPPEGRKRLLEAGRELSFVSKSVIVREGEDAQSFYVLLSGEVKVEAEGLDGTQREIDRLVPGIVFGEIAVLTAEKRTASVIATTDVTVLQIEILSLLGILKDYPDALADLKRLGLARSESLLDKTI